MAVAAKKSAQMKNLKTAKKNINPKKGDKTKKSNVRNNKPIKMKQSKPVFAIEQDEFESEDERLEEKVEGEEENDSEVEMAEIENNEAETSDDEEEEQSVQKLKKQKKIINKSAIDEDEENESSTEDDEEGEEEPVANVKKTKRPVDGDADDVPNKKSKTSKNSAPSDQNNTADWNKFKAEKKELKIQRKKNKVKELYDVSVEVIKIYEKLRCKSTKNKEELAANLHKLLKDGNKYSRLVLCHDTTRAVQCSLDSASKEVKQEIIEKLIPEIPNMITSKYAHHCVSVLIKLHANKNEILSQIIDKVMGNVVKFTTHNVSSSIIDTLYVTHANEQQKAYMRQEFYSDFYRKQKNKNVKTLKEAIAELPFSKEAILAALKVHLTHVENKKIVDHSLIHAVLVEYLMECTEEDRSEIITIYSPLLAQLSSTKEGSRAASLCFKHSLAKDRRTILKSIKEHVEKMCTHEFGHTVIFTILNSLDDTKLMEKYILDVVMGNIQAIVSNEYGRRVVEWIVAPFDTTFFHPKLISELKDCLKYGKKDEDIRIGEILKNVESSLIKELQNNPRFWLKNNKIGLVTTAIMKSLKSDETREVYGNIAGLICDPDWKIIPNDYEEEKKEVKAVVSEKIKKIKINPYEDEKKKPKSDPVVGIEDAGLHFVLKKLAKLDKVKAEANQPTFGEAVAEKLTEESLIKWLSLNRASFIVLNLFENGTKNTQDKLKNLIEPHKAILNKSKHNAGKILLEKLFNKKK